MHDNFAWATTTGDGRSTYFEDDGNTYAQATLNHYIGSHVLGMRRARLNPFEADVPEIGDEIAVGRAVTDLGHRLLTTAAADIESITPKRPAGRIINGIR